MPDADRAKLVALCTQYTSRRPNPNPSPSLPLPLPLALPLTRYGVTIVADDVYEMLQWKMDGSQPKPLRWHAQQQACRTNRSGCPATTVRPALDRS